MARSACFSSDAVITAPPAPTLDPEFAFGPGWYESSMDLRGGLDVREGLPADATPGEWLGASLLC